MGQPVTHHTVPALDALYLASRAARRALDHETRHPTAYHLSWRIAEDDRQYILSAGRMWAGAVQVGHQDQASYGIYRLFGHPVSVTPFRQEGRWPELVISIDRRNSA